MTTYTLNEPNKVMIVETTSPFALAGKNFPIIRTVTGSSVKVKDEDYVTHSYYTTLDSAWTYVQANFSNISADAIFNTQLSITDTNVSEYDIQPNIGDSVTINCEISVSDPNITLNYQWYKDEVEVPNATSSSISTTSLVQEHYGVYTCEVILVEQVKAIRKDFKVSQPVPPLTASTAIGASSY